VETIKPLDKSLTGTFVRLLQRCLQISVLEWWLLHRANAEQLTNRRVRASTLSKYIYLHVFLVQTTSSRWFLTIPMAWVV